MRASSPLMQAHRRYRTADMASTCPPIRVLALTRYSARGPSSRLRFTQFEVPLARHGFSLTVSPFFSDDYLDRLFAGRHASLMDVLGSYVRRSRALSAARDYNILWVEKELFPFLPAGAEALISRGIPIVADYDDAVFHRYDRHRSALVRRLLGRKFDPLLVATAATTVGNDYLASYACEHGARRIVHVPTVVDPTHYPQRCHDPVGSLRIGWIGTPANTAYLRPILTALQPLAKRRPLTLVTIGAGELEVGQFGHERHLWSEDREGSLLATCDIGVMPLPDTDFERGKCGYKLIQYMAAGLPVIASPVGINTQIVTPETGLLASSDGDWRDAVDWFATHRDALAPMGIAARARVEALYSIESAAATIAAEFRRALG